MKTTYFDSPSGKIAFQQSSGSGRPIVLVHGNSFSSRAFERQLASPLGKKRRLIAIDLPGHGKSADAADLATYSLPGYARILAILVKQLALEDAIFVGWSLGGHVILEAAQSLSKAAGFAIFGAPPVAFPPAIDKAFLPNPAVGMLFAAEMTKQQANVLASTIFKPGFSGIPQFFGKDALRTDGRAREKFAASLAPGGYKDEVEIVAKLKRPLAVLHGAEEQIVNGAYFSDLKMPTLWRGSVQTIAGAGHAAHWEQPEAFNALLDAFVEDVG